MNCRSSSGTTPLQRACGKGFIKMVKILIDAGAKVDMQDRTGNTAL